MPSGVSRTTTPRSNGTHFPILVLGDLPAIANYKKTLSVRFLFSFFFGHRSRPLGWRAKPPRFQIATAHCVGTVADHRTIRTNDQLSVFNYLDHFVLAPWTFKGAPIVAWFVGLD